MEKILSISLKLNFIPNTLGCFKGKRESSIAVQKELLLPTLPV